jgi:TolA-binding protein
VAAGSAPPTSDEPPRRVAGDGAAAPGPSASRAASNLFAQGIDAFRAGHYQEAELFWRSFLDRHGADPRAEDAAFLRAVGRARMGDAAGAGALAREYLQRFPRGMRRREAEALSRQGH